MKLSQACDILYNACVYRSLCSDLEACEQHVFHSSHSFAADNISNSAGAALCKSHIIPEDFLFFFQYDKMFCDASDGLAGVFILCACMAALQVSALPVAYKHVDLCVWRMDEGLAVMRNCGGMK